MFSLLAALFARVMADVIVERFFVSPHALLEACAFQLSVVHRSSARATNNWNDMALSMAATSILEGSINGKNSTQ